MSKTVIDFLREFATNENLESTTFTITQKLAAELVKSFAEEKPKVKEIVQEPEPVRIQKDPVSVLLAQDTTYILDGEQVHDINDPLFNNQFVYNLKGWVTLTNLNKETFKIREFESSDKYLMSYGDDLLVVHKAVIKSHILNNGKSVVDIKSAKVTEYGNRVAIVTATGTYNLGKTEYYMFFKDKA